MSKELDVLISHGDLMYASTELRVNTDRGLCRACGGYGSYEYKDIINGKLATQWKMSMVQRTSMSARESMYCAFCGCSYRLRKLAEAIENHLRLKSGNLMQAIEDGELAKLRIAEINSSGVLHEILKPLPGLSYSEYGSTDPAVPNEDIQKLSYPDNYFDLVLTSDTLEHVPDYKLALRETHRILKPGGAHIMTVPMLLDRKTRDRTRVVKGKTVNVLAGSYHGAGQPDYLVWHEFGYDFVDDVIDAGFSASLLFTNLCRHKEESAGVVVAQKPKHGDPSQPGVPQKLFYDSSKQATTIVAKLASDPSINTLPLVTEEEQIDHSWLSRRVEYLRNKIKLTEEHATNLQLQLDGYQKHSNDLEVALSQTRKRLETLERKLAVRLSNKLKKLVRR